ncbi:MAG: putative zinc protease [bacterium]|nr:putative zinc protease [bacterium]
MIRPKQSPLLPFHRETLPCGATLLLKENHSVPLAAVDLWVAAGAALEREDEGGISHFLEHLFFKGTPTRPVGVMDRQVKALGGYNNAATSYDFTHYYVVLPSEHVNLALEILTDALLNMSLPTEEIERERHVILEEIARKDDSPLGKLYDEFLKLAFAGTPYERPILGTPESLAGIDRDRFVDYRNRFYGPGNLHVAVAGDIHPKSVSDRLAELLGDLSPSEPSRPESLDGAEELKRAEFEIAKDVQQTYLCLGVRTPAVLGTPEEIGLDLIAALLGEGRSSRLVYRLMEREGLCSSVSAFAWTLDRIGLFGVEACYQGEDEHEVLSILEEEFQRVRTEAIPDEEIEKAKTQLLTGHALGLEKNSSMAGVLGRNSMTDRLEEVVAYEERVRSLSGEEAQEIVNRLCPPDGFVTGYVRPEKTR